MTLQQVKDQVAVKFGYADYHQIDCLEIEESEKDAIKVSILEQVIELYAKSKWDEAATLTNRNIIHHTSLSLADLPAKPEFKP